MKVECLIDTGATLSVIHPSYFQAIKKNSNIELTPCRGTLRMADGGLVPPWGRATLPLVLSPNQKISFTFVVADVEASVVLGLDFLASQFAVLDANAGLLTLNGIPHKCHDAEEQTHIFKVRVSETVTVQPGVEMLLPGKVDGTPNFALGLVEAHEQAIVKDGLLVAKAAVDPQSPDIPIRVINLTNEAHTVYEGTWIANCEPVGEECQSEDTIIGHVNKIQTQDECQLPDHLQQLYEDSLQYLPDEMAKRRVKELLCKYSHAFAKSKEDLGHTSVVKHKINTGTAQPIKQRPRRVPIAWRDESQAEVDRMLRQGVIQPSDSPWASPVVLVRKKDNSLRYCIDYRQVNNVTLKDSYPIPRIDDTLDALQGASLFSTLDLASGYWQVQMDEDDKGKTAFVTEGGLFEFNVMPFGLCNAPATFERLMEKVLAGLHWKSCLLYIDDIIVFGADFSSHLARLEEVLHRVSNAGLKISPKKCEWFRPTVKFLGHIVSAEGVKTDPDKIKAVEEWPTPTKTRDVRAFLGLCSYYRKFVRGFADIARPLHKLTEKDKTFVWTAECEVAFNRLKQSLLNAPILSYPTPNDPFVLDTDASGFGLGSVLSQIREGREYVIAYYSHALSRPEQQYCVTRRELLAIVMSLKHFHHYLYGRHITVRTDHGALRWLLGFKSPEGQMARWLEVIGTYDMEIVHRAGRQHGNADGLSRRPCSECKHCDRQEDKEANVASVRKICAITNAPQEESPRIAPWLQVWTPQELADWQRDDPSIAKLLEWKESADRPDWSLVKHESAELKTLWTMWPILEVHNQVLYKRYTNEGSTEPTLQLVAPPCLRRQVMYYLHTHRTAGHVGMKKTSANIRRRFWWPRIRDDIKRWCHTCRPCQQRKARYGLKNSPLQSDLVGSPMERVCIDILSFQEETDNGNTCVLVVSDVFTKWTEAFALPDHQALTVADTLVTEVFLKLGVPRILHCDQGREFESDLIKSICDLLEIKKSRTSPYRPQSDGQVERFNRTLISMLSMLCASNKQDWDDHLPYVLCAYRASVNESTGCSPNMVMLGREITLPIDLMYPHPQEGQYRCPIEYVEWVRAAMLENFERVRHQLGWAANRQKKYYDKRAQVRKFERGDWVWRLHPAAIAKSKLNFPYTGPFLVTSVVSEVNYEIQRSPGDKKLVVHVDHLKMFEGDEVPFSWLDPPVDIQHGNSTSQSNQEETIIQPVLSQDQHVQQDSIGSETNQETNLDTAPQRPPRHSRRKRQLPSKLKEFVLS